VAEQNALNAAPIRRRTGLIGVSSTCIGTPETTNIVVAIIRLRIVASTPLLNDRVTTVMYNTFIKLDNIRNYFWFYTKVEVITIKRGGFWKYRGGSFFTLLLWVHWVHLDIPKSLPCMSLSKHRRSLIEPIQR